MAYNYNGCYTGEWSIFAYFVLYTYLRDLMVVGKHYTYNNLVIKGTINRYNYDNDILSG